MKYVGSKARLSKDIAPIINNLIKENNIKLYVEPFVGGANMIDKINCKSRIGYDNNKYLIALWKALQNGYEPPETMTKEEYINVKNKKDEFPAEYVAIVGLCATYNAGWFRRWGGSAITKSGKVRNYYDEAVRNIKNQIHKIQDISFVCDTYENLKCSNALIYCDPPYQSSSYEMYDGKRFNYDMFWNKVREWSKSNIVLVSEYTAPNDFDCIFEKTLTTGFDNKQRKKDTEKLFIWRESDDKYKRY